MLNRKLLRWFIGASFFVSLLIIQPIFALAQNGTLPSIPAYHGRLTGNEHYDDNYCKFFITSDTDLVHEFKADGIIHRVDYKKQVVNKKSGTQTIYNDFGSGGTGPMPLYQIQKAEGDEFDTSSIYHISTPPSAVSIYFLKGDPQADDNASGNHGAIVSNPDAAGQWTYLDTATPQDNNADGTPNPFGIYLNKLHFITQGTADICKLFDISHGSYTAKDVNGKTMTIEQHDNSGTTTWYYVGYNNFSPPTGGNLTGYDYRSSKNPSQYIMVSDDDQGAIIADYGIAGEGDWRSLSSAPVKIDVFNKPGIPDSFVTMDIFMDLKSLVPSKINATQLRSGEEVTYEIKINGDKGPYVNKHLGHFSSDNTKSCSAFDSFSVISTKYDECLRGGVSDSRVQLVFPHDLDSYYGTASHTEHSKMLSSEIVVCAHKKLDLPTSPNVLEGKATIGLNPPDNSKIRLDGTTHWLPINDSITFPGQLIPATTCGSTEDKSVTQQAADSATQGLKTLLFNTILDALKSIGQIIQNFIIYVVSWAVSIASQNVPI